MRLAMVYRTRDQHLFDPGPKRILALDGGGIRGAVTLGYLARLEAILRERVGGDEEFRLCDYFDLIGGTSTGSIIATGLAMGYSVAELADLYRTLAVSVFERGLFRLGVFDAKFAKEPLERVLRDYLGDETLGSDKLRTGLMVVAKRLDTGSPWLMHNNPRGRYYDGDPEDDATPNREFLLRNVIRASSAAPHYFEPEAISVAPGVAGAFVDGAVSPHKSPALALLMLATLSGHGLGWPLGEDKLLLVSVGTGFRATSMRADNLMEMSALRLAAQAMLSVIDDTHWLGQTLLQWISDSPTAWGIDGEIGDLGADILGGGPPLISYLRYDLRIETEWLKDRLGLHYSEGQCARLVALDNPDNVEDLTVLGRAAAQIQVEPWHLGASFDLPDR